MALKHPNLTNEQLDEAVESFARCRTLRHAWEPIGGGQRKPAFGELVTYRCVFCGGLRYDKVSRLTGQRIATPQYDMPPGYRQVGKHDSNWWRATYLETIAPLVVTAESNVTPIGKKQAS